VSCRPGLIHPWLIWCRSGPSNGGDRKSSTSGESTSRKLLDCWVWKSSALGVIPGDGTQVRGGVHINRGRVGEERGGKEMDGCPLTEFVYVKSHQVFCMRGVISMSVT
jgi:hypothetical protein